MKKTLKKAKITLKKSNFFSEKIGDFLKLEKFSYDFIICVFGRFYGISLTFKNGIIKVSKSRLTAKTYEKFYSVNNSKKVKSFAFLENKPTQTEKNNKRKHDKIKRANETLATPQISISSTLVSAQIIMFLSQTQRKDHIHRSKWVFFYKKIEVER